jgi:hypothetical protein
MARTEILQTSGREAGIIGYSSERLKRLACLDLVVRHRRFAGEKKHINIGNFCFGKLTRIDMTGFGRIVAYPDKTPSRHRVDLTATMFKYRQPGPPQIKAGLRGFSLAPRQTGKPASASENPDS